MPEQPVEAGESPAEPPEAAAVRPGRLRGALPPVLVFVVLAVIGLPLGLLWSWLAPPILANVTDGTLVPQMATIYHFFDPMADFLMIGFGAGLVSGVVLWLLRRHRGPVILLAGVLGSLAAAWLAIKFGSWFATLEYPLPSTAPKPGALLSLPPELPTLWAILVQPLGLTIVYGIAASWNALDDLGRPEAPVVEP